MPHTVVQLEVNIRNRIIASLYVITYRTLQPAFTYSKSTIETPEQCVKSVQS